MFKPLPKSSTPPSPTSVPLLRGSRFEGSGRFSPTVTGLRGDRYSSLTWTTRRHLQNPRLRSRSRSRSRSVRCSAEESRGGGDQEGLREKLAKIAEAGKSLAADEIKKLLAEVNGNEDKEKQDANARKEKMYPPVLRKLLKEAGLWDRVPDEFVDFDTDFAQYKQQHLLTEEEWECLNDEDLPDPYDEEEEIFREETKLRAVRKLEEFLRSYPKEPDQVIGMAMELKELAEYDLMKDPTLSPLEEMMEEVYDAEVEIGEGVEKCFATLATGGKLPPFPWDYEREDGEKYRKRMQKLNDYYYDQHVPAKHRRLSKEEYKEIDAKWKEANEADPKSLEDMEFEVEKNRPAPTWPDWQQKHWDIVHHMYYLLRAAYIQGEATEPGRRLRKYGLIADDVVYEDHFVKLKGYDAYMEYMGTLKAAGMTIELANLFATMEPPQDEASPENPCKWDFVADFHLNVPLPNWYVKKMEELDALEAEAHRREEEEKEKDEFFWRDPLRPADHVPDFNDREMVQVRQDVSKQFREKRNKERMREKERKELERRRRRGEIVDEGLEAGGKVQAPGEDDGGPIWQGEDAGKKWMDGKHATINATVEIDIDIHRGQISHFRGRWGPMIGQIDSQEDVERIYRGLVGLDTGVITGNYGDKGFREIIWHDWWKDPIEWVREVLREPSRVVLNKK